MGKFLTELKERHAKEKVDLLNEKLAECTESQQAFFHQLFPYGPSEEKLDGAIDLIERTLTKNAKRYPKEAE